MADEAKTDAQEDQAANEMETAPASEAPTKPDDTPPAAEDLHKGTLDAGKPNEPAKGDGKEPPAQEPAKGELQALRERLAGGDEKLLKELNRYKSAESIGKAFRDNKKAASERKGPMRLPDKPTDDEVKAYREAYGIPDEATDYPVAFREDYEPTEADTEILSNFRDTMHERNIDPKAAEAALEWYQDFAAAQEQERNSRLAKTAQETQAELRSEWGGEYDGNIGAVREFMTAQLGDKGFDDMMALRLDNGSRLQDHSAFVKMMANVATDYYGSNVIFDGDIETTSQTVQERIDELLKLRNDDPDKYFSDGVQAKISKLYQQRDKINARKG